MSPGSRPASRSASLPTAGAAVATPGVDPAVADEVDRLAADGWAWFVRYTHPTSGLTLDGGANAAAVAADAGPPSAQGSIAATGYYLTLLPAAAERGLIGRAEVAERAAVTLRSAARLVEHVGGVMRHFVRWDTGEPFGGSEFSVLDTAIFLHGAVVAGRAFGGEVAAAADVLLDRVEWDALWVAHPKSGKPILSYGFDGKTRRLLPHGADVRSTENLMPAVLAAGSRTHPAGKGCWYHMAVDAGVKRPVNGWAPPPDLANVLNPGHGLFTAYYGLAWMDLRGLHDADGVDLWANARTAALFNREACRRAWAKAFKTYAAENGGWWGLSAGDGPPPAGSGRRSAYTVPNPVDGDPNGTVWPTAALAAFPWAPAELAADLPRWRQSDWWARARGPYGLSPLSVDRDWVGEKLLGIDVGSFVVNWWNLRSGTVHRLWQSHPVAARGLRELEFSRP